MEALKVDGDRLVSNRDPSYPPLTQVSNFLATLHVQKSIGRFLNVLGTEDIECTPEALPFSSS